MGDQPGSPSRVRTSEDKVRRKCLYGSVMTVYVLEKLSNVSGSGLVEAGRYTGTGRGRGRRRADGRDGEGFATQVFIMTGVTRVIGN
jgi:hypothetical protein